MRIYLLLLLLLVLCPSFAQEAGQITGFFQTDVQYYTPDSSIGALPVPEKVRTNGVLQVNYTKGKFSAGLRYESYLNALQGFNQQYKNMGIPYKYITYNWGNIEVTAGNFYEQFGKGYLLRTYEERTLGVDNGFDGFRIKATPLKGISIKGLIAKNRIYFNQSEGIVRAIDAEIAINDVLHLDKTKTQYSIGASFVSRFQKDNDPIYKLPENVGAYEFRTQITNDKWDIGVNYTHKINDPHSTNNYIYKNGNLLAINVGYATAGFGFLVNARRSDNMDFRVDRSATVNDLTLNFVPALTTQHTYNLAAFYPYGSQPNGEMSVQTEINYKLKKDTKLGGKYGTTIRVNVSLVNGINKTAVSNDTLGYASSFFSIGKTKHFRDINIEINKKITPKWKTTILYSHILYSPSVIQGLVGKKDIKADVIVLDINYKKDNTHSLRTELQHLYTKQDQGSWAMVLVEYTLQNKWYFTLLNQYNYGNTTKKPVYPLASIAFTHQSIRAALTYGKQRAGIYCTGGVCRAVPATNGVGLSVSGTF